MRRFSPLHLNALVPRAEDRIGPRESHCCVEKIYKHIKDLYGHDAERRLVREK